MAALRARCNGPVPGWKVTPKGAVSRLFDEYGMTPTQASAGRAARGPSARGRAPKNMESTMMQSAAKPSRMARRSRDWPGSGPMKIDEVVLHAPNATLGRRFTLGIGHHQIVGVVRSGEGHEPRARGLNGGPVVLGREEDDLVSVGDEPAGHGPQWRHVTLGRCRAQDEVPRPSAHGVTTAPPHGGSATAPATLDPSRPCSVLTVTVPATPSKDTVSLDMLSSTVTPSPSPRT